MAKVTLQMCKFDCYYFQSIKLITEAYANGFRQYVNAGGIIAVVTTPSGSISGLHLY